MDKLNLEQITGKSEEQRTAEALALLRQRNPALADSLEKGLEKVREKKEHEKKSVGEITITPAMRAGAKVNEEFHKHRLQGE